MSVSPGERREVDPDYFSLSVRRALGEPETAPDAYPDGDYLASVGEPSPDLLVGEFAALALHPDVVAAGTAVTDAEIAVLRAEESGVVDELAMRRLDNARRQERAALARLQKERTVAHTARAQSRIAQVIPLRRRAGRGRPGGEAA